MQHVSAFVLCHRQVVQKFEQFKHQLTSQKLKKIFLALRPNAGHGIFIHEVSRSYNDAPHSIQILWTRDQLKHKIYNRKASMPQRGSDQQSQLESGRRPTVWTAKPLGLIKIIIIIESNVFCIN